MEEKIGKKFLLYFRLALLCWILIANAILHIIGFSYGWLIFISNIMLFTLEGDVKERFLTVEIGGLVGLVLTVLAMLAISALTPIVGDLFGLLIPLRGSRAAHPRPPLCPQGAQQCRLCLSYLRLHRYRFIRKQHRAVHSRFCRRLAGVQRRMRPAHEADEGTRRQECDKSRKQRIKQISSIVIFRNRQPSQAAACYVLGINQVCMACSFMLYSAPPSVSARSAHARLYPLPSHPP